MEMDARRSGGDRRGERDRGSRHERVQELTTSSSRRKRVAEEEDAPRADTKEERATGGHGAGDGAGDGDKAGGEEGARTKDESEEKQQQTQQPASVVVKKARTEAPVDAQSLGRSKRLFGFIVGTLQTRINEKPTEKDVQRQQIEAKQDLKLAQAREELFTRQQREKEERTQQARVAQEQDEAKQLADLTAAWRTQHTREAGFLVTAAEPRLLFRPKKLLAAQEQALTDRRDKVEAALAETQTAAETRATEKAAARAAARRTAPPAPLTTRSGNRKLQLGDRDDAHSGRDHHHDDDAALANGTEATASTAATVAAMQGLAQVDDPANLEPADDYLISADADDQG